MLTFTCNFAKNINNIKNILTNSDNKCIICFRVWETIPRITYWKEATQMTYTEQQKQEALHLLELCGTQERWDALRNFAECMYRKPTKEEQERNAAFKTSKLHTQQVPRPCSAAARQRCSTAMLMSMSAWSLGSERRRFHDSSWLEQAMIYMGASLNQSRW